MRYKILFISSWFPNKLEPTNGNFVQRHAEAVSLFHEVEILHAVGDSHQKESFIVDDKVVNGIRTVVVYYRNSNFPLQNFMMRMKAYRKGFAMLKTPNLVHANVLHNNMLFAIYLKKKFKIPFVVTEHWTSLRSINHHKTPAKIKKIAKIIGNQAAFVLPVSSDLADGLKKIGIKTKMSVIPNVVNTGLFQPKNSDSYKFTFIHVSNLIPRKNADKILETAIRLFRKGYDFFIQIGGDGTAESLHQLNEIATKSGFSDNIEIFGMQTQEQVAQKMRNADCFILFSEDENQPCVIGESFASGIKVISTKVGGIAEFFPQNFGILLNEVNENLLENAMIQMIESSSSNRQELAGYAEEKFSKNSIGKRYSGIYHKVLG